MSNLKKYYVELIIHDQITPQRVINAVRVNAVEDYYEFVGDGGTIVAYYPIAHTIIAGVEKNVGTNKQ